MNSEAAVTEIFVTIPVNKKKTELILKRSVSDPDADPAFYLTADPDRNPGGQTNANPLGSRS